MRAAWCSVLLVAACAANDDIHPPQLATITPNPATPGMIVQLDGAYFCGEPDSHDEDEGEPLPCDATSSVQFDTSPRRSRLTATR